MFNRKARHIAFLEYENEMLRRQAKHIEQFASDIESGKIIKFMLTHPEYIQNGQITIYPDMLDSVSERDLIRVDSINGNKYTLRLNHIEE